MAKFIEGKDGSRMLVSDDTPDELDVDAKTPESSWMKALTFSTEALTPADPVSLLLIFEEEMFPVTPIQVDTFTVQNDKAKITGTMLLSDYAWLLEKKYFKVAQIQIRTENKVYNVMPGPLDLIRLVGKDINATTVNVHLSLKRYI